MLAYPGTMTLLAESDLLLELLREAGHEAVTLDELQIVGVRDPARALLELELAGHAVQRVYDQRTPCVRLGAPEPDLEPVRAPEPPRTAGPDLRVVLAGVLGVLVLVLLARRD